MYLLPRLLPPRHLLPNLIFRKQIPLYRRQRCISIHNCSVKVKSYPFPVTERPNCRRLIIIRIQGPGMGSHAAPLGSHAAPPSAGRHWRKGEETGS